MIRLGVNIDHVATVRNARGGRDPEPLEAAFAAQTGGADQITVHLREDRRHISDRDVRMLKETLKVDLNLEMAATDAMVEIALEVMPAQVTLVPEKREELTTEGGLDVAGQKTRLIQVAQTLSSQGLPVYLFVDPDLDAITLCQDMDVEGVELHTGSYANATSRQDMARELALLESSADLAERLDLTVNVGHGLNYHNVSDVARLPQIAEMNIGHAIVSRALFTGMTAAVRDMKELINKAVTI